MDNIDRIETVMKAVREGRDFSLIEKLQFIKVLKSKQEFRNYVLILFILIEKSRFYDSATTIFIKKIFKEKIYLITEENLTNDIIGGILIETIKRNAIDPFVNLSSGIRRLITTVVSTKSDSAEVANILALISRDSLTELNEFFLEKYLTNTGIDNNAMLLYYNCITDIVQGLNTRKLSLRANEILLSEIQNASQLQNYLKIFIRPFFSIQSSSLLEAEHYAPEPYYLQIFGSSDDFLNILNTADKTTWQNEDRLRLDEIVGFVKVYNTNVNLGIKFVDINKDLTITPSLHRNFKKD